MVKDHSAREETRWRHFMGYFLLAAKDPCYTSRGALAGTEVAHWDRSDEVLHHERTLCHWSTSQNERMNAKRNTSKTTSASGDVCRWVVCDSCSLTPRYSVGHNDTKRRLVVGEAMVPVLLYYHTRALWSRAPPTPWQIIIFPGPSV